MNDRRTDPSRLVAELRDGIDVFRPVLRASLPADDARRAEVELIAAFEELAPRLPADRGRPMRRNIVVAAWFLALCRVLRARGWDDEAAGEACYRVAEEMVRRRNPLAALVQRTAARSRLALPVLRVMAARTQRTPGPDDFVAELVEPRPGEFDYGIDITRCGICALFEAEGARELAKYMCRIDYLTTAANGVRLIRTGTIAEGADRCDFRFKKA